MSNKSMHEQLAGLVKTHEACSDDPVTPVLASGEADVKTPAGTQRVMLTPEQQNEMIENSLAMQRLTIHNKKAERLQRAVATGATIVLAGLMGYAAYCGATGKTNANPGGNTPVL